MNRQSQSQSQTMFSYRFLAVLRKEFAQMRRDRRLIMSLAVFPTIQLLLFTLVLNATVSDLKLGIIDGKVIDVREIYERRCLRCYVDTVDVDAHRIVGGDRGGAHASQEDLDVQLALARRIVFPD